ncbi:rhodanese-like domain-containing protein [Campylobacter geochelonis]|uniref:Thiosulfate sulfurtransferase PspE n=1 Tax=Campylobacter geochelonis TaxID=1780362 RepID=A0A128EAG0_9BACT|nr:rhodanese-like domain-containing protein [Campylobacter geochelonis]QKF70595.1 putative rhodanese-related sulfurtransferase (tandem rhodanese domains) [Campylobacter geochelonis]CZE45964.1 Thiosulfate sulfurtransferase PspE precursor [Campylobacter geochelonis]CZE50362.1 Thiosulfate sulfurtransferase PspE precursor [Campylobacter geochelonis]
MSNFKKFITLGAVFVALVFTACSDTKVTQIKGSDLAAIQNDNKKKENYLVIDVRSKKEYDAGHLKHAINIPLEELNGELLALQNFKDKNVVLYCNTGNKSGKALKILQENGFKKVYNGDGVKQFEYNLTSYKNVLGSDLQKASDDASAVIVDVREAKDFAKGHLKGAINIPDGTPIDEAVAMLEPYKNKKIIAHCYSGNRSAKLANELSKRGFSDVSNSLDGTKEYEFNLVK